MTTRPIEDWEATVLARVRRMGLLASARDGEGCRMILVKDRDGHHPFHVVLRPTAHGFVAGIVRPEDHQLSGMPHATGSRGVLEPVEDRTIAVDPSDRGSGERLIKALTAEIAHHVEVPAPVAVGTQEFLEKSVDRLIDLVAGDPETARVALAKTLAVLPPGTLKGLFDDLERHVEDVPGPRFG